MKRRNRGEKRGKRVNEEKEEKGTENRTLRDTSAKTERRRERRTKRDTSATVGEEGAKEADSTGRKAKREKTREEGRVPDSVKGFREVKRSKNSAEMGFGVVETIGYHLEEVGDIGAGRPERTKARLVRR